MPRRHVPRAGLQRAGQGQAAVGQGEARRRQRQGGRGVRLRLGQAGLGVPDHAEPLAVGPAAQRDGAARDDRELP